MTTARFRFTRPGGTSAGFAEAGPDSSFSPVRSTTCESGSSCPARSAGCSATGTGAAEGASFGRAGSVAGSGSGSVPVPVPVPAAAALPNASRPHAARRSSARLFPAPAAFAFPALPGVGLLGSFQRSTTRARASSRCATPPPSTATFSGLRRSAPFLSTGVLVSASFVPAGMDTARSWIGRYSYATILFGPSVSASLSTRFSHAGWSLYRSLKLAETFATSSHCTTRRPPKTRERSPSFAGSPSASPGARHPEPALFMSACKNCR
mmetsp:Transcript_3581/g.15158  ORF Transcript_3581/g.15158 Transcript_3581/m.15158 type:complete len:266 (-) Transcript_3581:200-997(-)